MCSACYGEDLERRREESGGVLVAIVTARRQGADVQCAGCPKHFYRAPSSKSNYHSLKCFHEHRRRLRTVTCARSECGQTYDRPPSQLGKYCSHVACQRDGTTLLSRGWDHLDVSVSMLGLAGFVNGNALPV